MLSITRPWTPGLLRLLVIMNPAVADKRVLKMVIAALSFLGFTSRSGTAGSDHILLYPSHLQMDTNSAPVYTDGNRTPI